MLADPQTNTAVKHISLSASCSIFHSSFPLWTSSIFLPFQLSVFAVRCGMEGWVERRSVKWGRGWVFGKAWGGGLREEAEHPGERCAPGVVNMQVAYFWIAEQRYLAVLGHWSTSSLIVWIPLRALFAYWRASLRLHACPVILGYACACPCACM